jgi:bacterioferritin-associated ferredoxin
MYVCLCEAVSDRTIQKAIDSGCDTVKKIRDNTGAAKQCCKCVADIQQMLKSDAMTKTAETAQLFCHA